MSETTYDFNDGHGTVPAHQHPNGGGWVADTAMVHSTAYVGPNARVYGSARVCDNAEVYGTARVYENAQVYGKARVYGEAWVHGNAQVYGEAHVYGEARVYGNAHVCDTARVYGDAWVYGNEPQTPSDNRDTIIAALRAEVKAWREQFEVFENTFPGQPERYAAVLKVNEMRKATDALGALNEEKK